MRAAIIENGVVTNIIKVQNLAALPGLVAAPGARIGDTYRNGEFIKPAEQPAPVPTNVSRRQARQALLMSGLLDNVEPLIEAIPDLTERRMAQIWWADALDFDRNHPLVIRIGAGLGLDAAGLDALFVQAAGL